MNAAPAAAPTGPRLLAIVFLPFAAGYYVSFLFRNVNSVAFPELTQAFDLSPGALGFLTSAYFLTFAGAQLPLGILMDRYGPRRVNATMLLVAALGAVVFASAASLPVLVLGRALIGLGVAVCLMSSMTAFVLWFPLERMATPCTSAAASPIDQKPRFLSIVHTAATWPRSEPGGGAAGFSGTTMKIAALAQTA